MFTLKELLNQGNITLEELATHLDQLEPADRVGEAMSLGRKEQVRLWHVSARSEGPLPTDYLVPAEAQALIAFPFEGRNSLPLFSRFQKVFYRTGDGVLGGYNKQSLEPLTGPGYFVVRRAAKREGELEIDYTLTPDAAPDGFPAIKPNEGGLSRFVFAGMKDYLRRVSKDVLIGRATKQGKEMDNWFVLCRPAS